MWDKSERDSFLMAFSESIVLFPFFIAEWYELPLIWSFLQSLNIIFAGMCNKFHNVLIYSCNKQMTGKSGLMLKLCSCVRGKFAVYNINNLYLYINWSTLRNNYHGTFLTIYPNSFIKTQNKIDIFCAAVFC